MKKIRFIFIYTAIIVASSLHAQLRVAVLIVGDYYPTTLDYQWNGGNLNGQSNWKEFWNDSYLLWELLDINSNMPGYGYDYIYIYFADGEIYDPLYLDLRYQVPAFTPFPIAEASLENVQDVLTGFSTGGDFPLLDGNDFLFIWTMGHGGYDVNGSYMNLYDDDVLYDDVFGNLVNGITAQKKVIFMQQGYAGGFANNLTGDNVIFYSACDENTNAYQADDFPYLENEILSNGTYYHGEFDFHTYSPMAGKSPDGVLQYYNGILYTTADADVNSIVSIDEIYDWESNWTGIGSLIQDPGNIASTTSLKYPSFLAGDVAGLVHANGYFGITETVHVLEGATLMIDDNTWVFLDYNGELIINEGAELIIGKNVNITAKCIYGSRNIIVNGNITIGEEVYFNGNSNNDNELIITISSPGINVYFNNDYFTGVLIRTYNNFNSFENCTFHSGKIEGYYGSFDINYCQFGTSSYVHLINNLISRYTNITNCDFLCCNPYSAIILENYPRITLHSNDISVCLNGIELYNCGRNFGSVYDCSIINCTGTGLLIYHSWLDITHNHIYNNGFGIKSHDRSAIHLEGNHSVVTQEIRDNESWEVYATSESFPQYFHYNLIQDDDNEPGDPLVKYSGPFAILDVPYNCWGINFNYLNDLQPANLYFWHPVWNCPEGAGSGVASDAEEIYLEARASVEIEDYNSAKSALEEIVSEYPESINAQAAMKELYAIEELASNNYIALKSYYDADSTIQNNEDLAKLADFLANFCDIRLENYPTAIAWFEDVIQNPGSFEDSIFAIIDLGYTYFLIENGQKSSYVGNMPQFKPVSVEQFEENRDYLLSLLPGDKLSETMKESIGTLKSGELLQNVPNPFNGFTQIWYKLDNDSDVTIKIFDYTGKQIRAYNQGAMDKGSHFIEFSSAGLPSGIYFYTLEVNGQLSDSKKMTVMK